MRTIVHRTPGLIDIRAFTLMGASAKPNSTNPIGQFGTGLKYAIAVLVRMGVEPVVFIGRDKYTFYCEKADFRGSEFDQIRMRREKFSLTRASKHDLPYTTSYGKNWKPWMVFRELHSNTLDENGETFEVTEDMLDDWGGGRHLAGQDGHTTIIIESDVYAEAWDARNDVFLVGAEEGGKAGVQVLPGQSDSIYYRGLRALDVSRPTLFTYNVNQSTHLTEDRTMLEYHAREYVGRLIVTSDDESFIETVVTAKEGVWEYEMELPAWATPSAAFKRVMGRKPRGVYGRASAYWMKHDDSPLPTGGNALSLHPKPWSLSGTTVFDKDGKAVMTEPYQYPGRWPIWARAFLKSIGNPVDEEGNFIPLDEAVFADAEAPDTPEQLYSVADALLIGMGVRGEECPLIIPVDEDPF